MQSNCPVLLTFEWDLQTVLEKFQGTQGDNPKIIDFISKRNTARTLYRGRERSGWVRGEGVNPSLWNQYNIIYVMDLV